MRGSRTSRSCSTCGRRSSPTTCTRSTCRRPTRWSATAWSSSACSTITRISPRAWPSTAIAAPAVGAIYDGTGHGTDGTAWGGEILLGDLRSFERIGHLPVVRLPGGDRAVREPWRMACAWLVAVRGEIPAIPVALRDHVAPDRWDAVARMALSGFAAPETSSMGRLFDAVAALCGVRPVVTYEGQAAIELEALADVAEHGSYPGDAESWIAAVATDAGAGVPVGVVSARFHRAVAAWTARGVRGGGHGARGPVRRRVREPPAADLDGRAAGGARPHRPGPGAPPPERRRDLLRPGGGRGGADGLIRWRSSHEICPEHHMGAPGRSDRLIATLAAPQHGIVSRTQLLATGVTRRQIAAVSTSPAAGSPAPPRRCRPDR